MLLDHYKCMGDNTRNRLNPPEIKKHIKRKDYNISIVNSLVVTQIDNFGQRISSRIILHRLCSNLLGAIVGLAFFISALRRCRASCLGRKERLAFGCCRCLVLCDCEGSFCY